MIFVAVTEESPKVNFLPKFNDVTDVVCGAGGGGVCARNFTIVFG